MAENSSPNYKINLAFLGMQRRAEAVDRQTLVQSFVDIGPLIPVLSSRDHQVIYGRRGTDKTHALLYVSEELKNRGFVSVYLDLRNLGSSGGLYADPSLPLSQRATRLLLDVLAGTHDALLQQAIDGTIDVALIGPALDALADAATEIEVVGTVERESKAVDTTEAQHSSNAKLALQPKPSLELGSGSTTAESVSGEYRLKESGDARYRVHFGRVGVALRDLLKAMEPKKLLLVFDEWSTIPVELQPYLADLVRRAVFPISGITVKIAAIEQRSNFKIGTHTDYTGIEIGADASADVDLDDYMVFDNNAEKAVEFFQELLFRHYNSEAGDKPGFASSKELVQAAFTQWNAFEDFVKSAEGVPRDGFNVLSVAAQRNMSEKISIPTVRIAARSWFQRDKEGAIRSNPDAQELLHWIVDAVIAHRRARAFLLRAGTRNPLIDALFDARLLHVFKKSISGHDEPGVRYDAYKLDYGCYVDLLATSKAPTHELFVGNEDDETVAASIKVPSDDYRAIRRAILNLNEFEKREKKDSTAGCPPNSA